MMTPKFRLGCSTAVGWWILMLRWWISLPSSLRLGIVVQAKIFYPFNDQSYATCGDCFCIPAEGQGCPDEEVFFQDTSPSRLRHLEQATLLNPVTLNCNPYEDASCDTVPPLSLYYGNGTTSSPDAVCGVQILPDSTRTTLCDRLWGRDLSCARQFEYQLGTFASAQEAANQGYTVTHEGPCGVCSTLQDLAVWLKYPDLAAVGTLCSVAAVLTDYDAALACYASFGFTPECASIWIYNGFWTNQQCLDVCVEPLLTQEPNNGPAPDCTLNECLQCDEDESVPIFRKFSGRTRRRSGILSAIVRPCDSLVFDIPQIDPCDEDFW